MKKIIDIFNTVFGLNPPKLNIKIIDVEMKSDNKTQYCCIKIEINNNNNNPISLLPDISTNIKVKRITNKTISDPKIMFNGNIVDKSAEFPSSGNLVINANSINVHKTLIYKTNWDSDIVLTFSDSNKNTYRCEYNYSKIKHYQQPKSGWAKGTI